MATFTCEEALQEIGMGIFHKKVIFLFGMVFFTEGAESMVISLLGSWIQCDFKVQEIGAAMMNASVFIGLAIGGSIQGYLLDFYGRKRTLVLLMSMLTVISTLFALSPSYKWVKFLRFTVGLFLGQQAVTYAVEFFPTEGRKYVLFIKTFWSIGTFFIMGCAYVVMMYGTWRTLMMIVAAISMLCTFLLVMCIPESPRFLLSKGKLREATGVLRGIADINGTALPRGHLENENVEPTETKVSIGALLEAAYLKTTIVLFFLWVMVTFLYYGISILSVTYMLKKGTLSEENKIQCSSCTSISDTYYILQMIFAVADLIGNLMVVFIVDILKRKTTFMAMCLLTLIPILCLNVVNSGFIVSLTLFVTKIGVAGIMSALLQYTVEVYPTVIRGTGAAFANNGYAVGAALTPFVSEVLVYISLPWTLTVYSVVMACSFLACWSLNVETAGKRLKDY